MEDKFKDFITDVTKTYAEDTKDDPNIEITMHTPENHGNHGNHSQFNFHDFNNDNTTKFRIPEE
jgi:hypothetical protein